MSTCQSQLPGVQSESQEGTTDVTDTTDGIASSVPSVKSVVSPLDSRPAAERPSLRPSPRGRGGRRPPSARDLRMYERVVVEEVSQYVVAADATRGDAVVASYFLSFAHSEGAVDDATFERTGAALDGIEREMEAISRELTGRLGFDPYLGT